MGQDTKCSIGKVVPLRQHRRDPAAGSALARLLARVAPAGAGCPDAPVPEPMEGEGIDALKTWLGALDGLESSRVRQLECDAGRLRVAGDALSETLDHLRRLRGLALEQGPTFEPASDGGPRAPATLDRIESALDSVARTRDALTALEQRFEAARQEACVARANLAAARASEVEVAAALARAGRLRADVVRDARAAALSLDVPPAVVLKLVR